ISAAASVVAVFQLSKLLVQSCSEYCEDFKNAKEDIRRLRQAATDLYDILEDLKDIYDNADAGKLSALARLVEKDGTLAQCKTEIEVTMRKLDGHIDPGKASSARLRKCLMWPFDKKKMDEKIGALQKHRDEIQLAIASDQLSVTLSTKAQITALRADALIRQAIELREKIIKWLPGADTSSNYNAAQNQHHKGTCSWLFETQEYREWKVTPQSFLWLYGIPGCGKTVMSSTVIDDLLQNFELDHAPIVAYFYFSFGSQRDGTNFLASLIQQLLGQSKGHEVPEELRLLHFQYHEGTAVPSGKLIKILQILLISISSMGHEIFIVIDAVDECPKGERRNAVLEITESIAAFKCDRLHVLLASRPEHDIRRALSPILTVNPVPLDRYHVQCDVALYVQAQVQNDSILKKWDDTTAREIELTLVDKAEGMFRWVYCQLVELRKCRTKSKLKKALKTLPETLDETYTRILDSMDFDDRTIAQRALTWLAFVPYAYSTVEQVAEAAAVDPSQDVTFDVEDRLQDPETDLCDILGSLIVIYDHDEERLVRLAHLTVKEYLLSQRTAKYGITELGAYRSIVEVSVSYLLGFCNLSQDLEMWAKYRPTFCLLPFIARTLTQYVKDGHCESIPQLTTLFLTFKKSEEAYKAWISQKTENDFHLLSEAGYIASTSIEYLMHLACACGFPEVVKVLLEEGADPRRISPTDPTCIGMSPLHCAACEGHACIVGILIDLGVEVDIRDQEMRTPLLCTMKDPGDMRYAGALETARMLIRHRADVNAEDVHGVTVLYTAAERNTRDVIELLIANGAKVDCPGASDRNITPLYIAACHGHEKVLESLLKCGAEIDRKNNCGQCALHGASVWLNPEAVEVLLCHGASVNTTD
ncbi:hypothetical protein BU16DRAFT_419460, partial [Lophium mytilinum]